MFPMSTGVAGRNGRFAQVVMDDDVRAPADDAGHALLRYRHHSDDRPAVLGDDEFPPRGVHFVHQAQALILELGNGDSLSRADYSHSLRIDYAQNTGRGFAGSGGGCPEGCDVAGFAAEVHGCEYDLHAVGPVLVGVAAFA